MPARLSLCARERTLHHLHAGQALKESAYSMELGQARPPFNHTCAAAMQSRFKFEPRLNM